MDEIGTGVFDWDRGERISDRYGSVRLFYQPGPRKAPVKLRQENEGERGQLVAVVSETRDSPHVGDLFHRVFPSKPNVGDMIVLGEGILFFQDDAVGLVPDDDRTTLWLDIRALYRLHNQTVTLFFKSSVPC
ncbi:MAG: hypothetical protein ACRD8A_05500 [Candidatus Acidiferrales bacterium]